MSSKLFPVSQILFVWLAVIFQYSFCHNTQFNSSIFIQKATPVKYIKLSFPKHYMTSCSLPPEPKTRSPSHDCVATNIVADCPRQPQRRVPADLVHLVPRSPEFGHLPVKRIWLIFHKASPPSSSMSLSLSLILPHTPSFETLSDWGWVRTFSQSAS